MIIEHKGKKLKTEHTCELSHDECRKLSDAYYKKPDFSLVNKQLIKVNNGGVRINHIKNYYFKDLMSKAKQYHSKWSVEELFECDDLIRYFYAKTLLNEKVFPKDNSDIKNIEASIRLGGKGVARNVSNFPLKTINMLLDKYNINDKYYDFCCGWGVRLLGALNKDIEYYGTDPNFLLVDRLNQLGQDYNKANDKNINSNIKAQGAEVFVEEWRNKIGFAFSSPPYFNLEDYRVGEQSWNEGMGYREWMKSFMLPTIRNIYKYLVDDGIFAININDFDGHKLVEHTIKIAEKVGFKHIDTLELKNISRTKSNGEFNNNDEGIYIFKKTK